MSYLLINATPHPVNLDPTLFTSHDVLVVDYNREEVRPQTNDLGHWVLPPTGWGLPAVAEFNGDRLHGSVEYAQSPKMVEDLREIMDHIEGIGGGFDTIVICSAISASAVGTDTHNPLGGSVYFRSPVFADEACRLPPAQRWADRLARAW